MRAPRRRNGTGTARIVIAAIAAIGAAEAPAPGKAEEAPPEAVQKAGGSVVRVQVRSHSSPDLKPVAAFALARVPGLVTTRGMVAGADEAKVERDGKEAPSPGLVSEDALHGAAALSGPEVPPLPPADAPDEGQRLWLLEPGEKPLPLPVRALDEISGGERLLLLSGAAPASSLGAPLVDDEGRAAALLVKANDEPVAVPLAEVRLGGDPSKPSAFHAADPDDPLRWYFRAGVLNALGYHEGALLALRSARGKGGARVQTELGVTLALAEKPKEAKAALSEAIRQLGGSGSLGVGGIRTVTGLSKEEEATLLEAGWRGMGRAHGQLGEHAEAADAFRRAIRLDAERAETHHLLGQALMGLKDYPAAEKEIREAIRLDPDDPAPRYTLATLLLVLDRMEEAKRLAEESKGLGDDARREIEQRIAAKEKLDFMRAGLVDTLKDMGLLYQMLGQLDRAVDTFQQAVQESPSSAELRALLGGAYYDQGEFERAAAAFQEAVRLKRDYPEAWLNFGAVHQARGDPDAALRCFEEALRQRPGFAEAHLNRGIALMSRNAWDAALAAFDEALKAKPDLVSAKVNAALLKVVRGRRDELGPAIAALQEADPALAANAGVLLAAKEMVLDNPTFPIYRVRLGEAYAQLGLWDRALSAFQEAAKALPNIPEIHYYLGISNGYLRHPDKALYEYQEALRLKPEYPDARVGLGNVYLLMRRPDAAGAEFEAALRFQPKSTSGLFGLARARIQQRRRNEARAILDKLRKLQDEVLAKALENMLIE